MFKFTAVREEQEVLSAIVNLVFIGLFIIHLYGSHQCPKDGENPGSSQDEQPPQSLWVVGLHDLDDPQQRLDSWSPEVTHVQPLQVYQTRPTAYSRETGEKSRDRHALSTHFRRQTGLEPLSLHLAPLILQRGLSGEGDIC